MNRAWQLQPGRAAWLEAPFPGPVWGRGSAHAFLGNQSSPGYALQWLSTLFLGTSRDGHSPLPPGRAPALCGAHLLGGAGTLRGVCTLILVVPSAHLLARCLLWLPRTPPACSLLGSSQFSLHPQRTGPGLYVLGPSCHTPFLLLLLSSAMELGCRVLGAEALQGSPSPLFLQRFPSCSFRGAGHWWQRSCHHPVPGFLYLRNHGWKIRHEPDLPGPGIEPRSPVLQADSLLSEPSGKPE